jgi:hypothetical protein
MPTPYTPRTRQRKMGQFHSDMAPEKIRATHIIERLQKHFDGEIELSMTQIRTAEKEKERSLGGALKWEESGTRHENSPYHSRGVGLRGHCRTRAGGPSEVTGARRKSARLRAPRGSHATSTAILRARRWP